MLPISTELIPEHEVHVYHHSDPNPARISLKVERNSKSLNWEISVSNASSPEESVDLYLKTLKELSANLPTT